MDWLAKFEKRFDKRWNGAFIDERDFHFHRRLYERYGIVLGPGDFSAMLTPIQRGRIKPVKKGNDGGDIYGVRVPSCGEMVLVVATRKRFRTAYPPFPVLLEMGRLQEAMRERNGA